MIVFSLYVNMLFDIVSLRGVGVLTCVINLETRDIWSLSYVRIMVPTCHNSDVLCWGCGPSVWAASGMGHWSKEMTKISC